MKQWVGGLLATVIGGVLIFWLTIGFPQWFGRSGGDSQVSNPPPAHMGELQWGTNLQGSDIANFDKPNVNTAGECSDLCLPNTDGKAMTFVQHPLGSGGVCWLKDGVPAPSPSPAMQSAVKITPLNAKDGKPR